MVAGSSTVRTIVASTKTATARPSPSWRAIPSGRVRKTANTTTMIAAALVTVPAVRRDPAGDRLVRIGAPVEGLLDAGEDEDLVVHRQPEQDREDEDRDEVLTRRAGSRAPPNQPSWKTSTSAPKAAPVASRLSTIALSGIAIEWKTRQQEHEREAQHEDEDPPIPSV